MTDSPHDPHPDVAHPEAARLEIEFDVLMARAGLVVPSDQRPTLLAGFAQLREQMALLHGRRDATAEPANIFALHPFGATA